MMPVSDWLPRDRGLSIEIPVLFLFLPQKTLNADVMVSVVS